MNKSLAKTAPKMDLSRREMIRRTVALTVLAATPAALLSACGGPEELSCRDESALSNADRDGRRNAIYIDRATDASRACSGCNFYQAAAANTCGGCTVVRGPINPAGSCNLFVARA